MGLDSVVGLVRNLMELSATVGDVGDDGAVPSLWSQLPKIVVVGGQVRPSSRRFCPTKTHSFRMFAKFSFDPCACSSRARALTHHMCPRVLGPGVTELEPASLSGRSSSAISTCSGLRTKGCTGSAWVPAISCCICHVSSIHRHHAQQPKAQQSKSHLWCRVPASRPCWKQSWARTFCREAQTS